MIIQYRIHSLVLWIRNYQKRQNKSFPTHNHINLARSKYNYITPRSTALLGS